MTKKNDVQSRAKEEEFKGKPVLGLYRNEGDKYPLKFGLAKAGLILANMEAIKTFCAKHEKQEVPATA
ncbi:MAG: hypothetical protein KGI84_08385 [Elusimicrobia bacterium]|nr:hypothetical protein [Elusimicrobiota bacterium]